MLWQIGKKKGSSILVMVVCGVLLAGLLKGRVPAQGDRASAQENELTANRTMQIMIREAKEDYDSLFQRLSHVEDDMPVIAVYDGGAFEFHYTETKETFFVEIWSEDGKTLLFSDYDPVTAGEIREAIKPYAPKE